MSTRDKFMIIKTFKSLKYNYKKAHCMPQKIKKMISELEKSGCFREWKKERPDYKLAHVFKMMDDANKNIWQVGYFNPHNDMIATFVVEETVELNQEEAAFKKPGSHIKELDLNKVRIGYEKAISIAEELRKKEYLKEMPIKMFFILQNLPEGQVYNITYISATFKTLNIKVDSDSGKIKKHSLISIFEFDKKS